MRNLLPVYAIEARLSMQRQAQYRGAAFVSILGFLVEPIVYLIVWRTVTTKTGPINGYGVDEFTSYYIVWTLVRVFNLALAPGAWDWWVRSGRIANDLLHPVDPYHRNLAGMAGAKIVWIAAWVPVAVSLGLLFHPSLSPTPLQIVTFFAAAWIGYVVRFNILWVLGLVSFWTTRAEALVEVGSPWSCCCRVGSCPWPSCRSGCRGSRRGCPSSGRSSSLSRSSSGRSTPPRSGVAWRSNCCGRRSAAG